MSAYLHDEPRTPRTMPNSDWQTLRTQTATGSNIDTPQAPHYRLSSQFPGPTYQTGYGSSGFTTGSLSTASSGASNFTYGSYGTAWGSGGYPTSSVSSVYTALPAGEESDMLPCEFRWYSNCNEWFPLDNPTLWIDHVKRHLQNKLPKICECWFCDEEDGIFDSTHDRHLRDRSTAFHNRMLHIRNHFLQDNLGERNIRPDFAFLKHLRRHGFISEDMYNAAKNWHEVPTLPGLYPLGWRPPVLERNVGQAHDLAREDRERERKRKRAGKQSNRSSNQRSN